MPSTLAVVATIPGRELALAGSLRSLRPQVDELKVVCHDMTSPPDVVRELADEWICEPDRRGSAAKLHWSSSHVGLYLGCDDDFEYPADYVDVMRRYVKRWKGRALVVGHGRILKPDSREFGNVVGFWPPQAKTEGTWLNYPGACALAFDSRLGVPSDIPRKNQEEAYLAVWAQRRRVPIWLVPHAAGWLRYLLNDRADLPTIWTTEKKAGFANRNAVISQIGDGARWRVFEC